MIEKKTFTYSVSQNIANGAAPAIVVSGTGVQWNVSARQLRIKSVALTFVLIPAVGSARSFLPVAHVNLTATNYGGAFLTSIDPTQNSPNPSLDQKSEDWWISPNFSKINCDLVLPPGGQYLFTLEGFGAIAANDNVLMTFTVEFEQQ